MWELSEFEKKYDLGHKFFTNYATVYLAIGQ